MDAIRGSPRVAARRSGAGGKVAGVLADLFEAQGLVEGDGRVVVGKDAEEDVFEKGAGGDFEGAGHHSAREALAAVGPGDVEALDEPEFADGEDAYSGDDLIGAQGDERVEVGVVEVGFPGLCELFG